MPILARHAGSGAFLMADAGRPLRQPSPAPDGLASLAALLPRYAAAQRAAAADVPDLIALGLPDWSLPRLPGLLAGMLEDGGGAVAGLTAAETACLAGTIGTLRGLCRRLDELGLPATLDHGDLNDGNIFVSGGMALIGDWGETVVGHPFLSLVNLVQDFRRRHGRQAASRLEPAISGYLAAWAGTAAHRSLLAAMEIAERLYPVRYALGFHRLWRSCDPGEMEDLRGWSAPALRQWMAIAAGPRPAFQATGRALQAAARE